VLAGSTAALAAILIFDHSLAAAAISGTLVALPALIAMIRYSLRAVARAAGHVARAVIRALTHAEGKPFSYPELRPRVEALLPRADVRRRPGRLRVGELEIDAVARVMRLRGAGFVPFGRGCGNQSSTAR
jgi:hypothetical protein